MLNQKYGQEVVDGKKVPIIANYGKVHEYNGMTIDYSIQKKVKLTIYEYIYKLINELPKDMNEIATLPGSSNLFEVNI